MATQIAEETITDADTSMLQLSKNLISLISQKSAEMNLLHCLLSNTSEMLQEYFTDIFTHHQGRVELCREDINEAAESIRRSRKISIAFNEAQDFEDNFLKLQSKIPKNFFIRTNVNNTTETKAMIFTVGYIKGRQKLHQNL